jgi:hypothetical protein
MARITCKCGRVLSNVEAPNEVEYTVYNNFEWFSIISKDKIDPMLDIPHPQLDVWKCPICERIYIFKYGEDSPIKVYNIEHDLGGI